MDARAPTPKHAQLTEILRRELALLEPDYPLPSEAALCREHGVSRTTVRQALGQLAREGLLYTVQGKGAFVAGRAASQTVSVSRSLVSALSPAMDQADMEIGVLEQRKAPAGAAVAGALAIEVGAPYVRIVMLRSSEGLPYDVLVHRLPETRFKGLEAADLSHRPLYELLAQEYGAVPLRGERMLTAEACGEQEAAWLQVPAGAPLLVQSWTLFDHSGRPIDFGAARQRGDRALFRADLG